MKVPVIHKASRNVVASQKFQWMGRQTANRNGVEKGLHSAAGRVLPVVTGHSGIPLVIASIVRRGFCVRFLYSCRSFATYETRNSRRKCPTTSVKTCARPRAMMRTKKKTSKVRVSCSSVWPQLDSQVTFCVFVSALDERDIEILKTYVSLILNFLLTGGINLHFS